jgi:hypothetical protein
MGAPPWGAQLPPSAVPGVLRPCSEPIPRHVAGAGKFFSPPVQFALSKVVRVLPVQRPLVGGSHVQALHARVSVPPWKYACAVG